MKKILVVVLCLLLILALTACDKETKNTDSAADNSSQTANTSSEVLKENNTSVANGKTSSGSAQPDNTNKNNGNSNINQSEQSHTETSSKGAVTSNNTNQSVNTSSKESQISNNLSMQISNNLSMDDIDNGVLESATAQKMDLPQNLKFLGTNNARVENNSTNTKTMVVIYQLDGNVVNWTIKDDLLYVITSGNNQLAVINAETMIPISNIPLAGRPAEINFVGDEIYISMPDLCRIDVFSKSNFAKTASVYFQHEVSSFCVDGNYIYYSDDDQHCEVFKRNMTTNELTRIGTLFYQPKLYLNKQDNILYIGETGTTGGTLYYYDATTLQIKSLFKKNNYGIMNHTRDMFHVGDEIFWGNYRFSDTDAKQIIGRYGEADYGSVNYASEQLVSTFEGIFLTDTYECIVNYWDSGFRYDYILVSDSYNVFFRARGFDKNIIMGVYYGNN